MRINRACFTPTGTINFNDLMGTKRPFLWVSNLDCCFLQSRQCSLVQHQIDDYANHKLANVLFSNELHWRRFASTNVPSIVVHPVCVCFSVSHCPHCAILGRLRRASRRRSSSCTSSRCGCSSHCPGSGRGLSTRTAPRRHALCAISAFCALLAHLCVIAVTLRCRLIWTALAASTLTTRALQRPGALFARFRCVAHCRVE